MKKLLLTILTAILSLANVQAQTTDGYLTNGDIVSISFDNWGWGNPYYYIEANNNGIQTVQAVTTNCLWEIGISKNGNEYEYTFKHTSLNRYLSIKDNGNQNYSLLLSTQPTLFRIKEANNNAAKAYLYGQIYYTASGNIPVHLNCENSYFHARTWWSTSLHIEKWTQSGSGNGTMTGYFSPQTQKFGLAPDDDAARAQAVNAKFTFPTHIHSFYQCVNRPELTLGGGEAEVTKFPTPTFYWKSQGKNGSTISVLNPNHYQVPTGAPAIERRNMLELSDVAQDNTNQNIWNFTITPLHKSPKNLQHQDKYGTYRWVNYMDTLVAEYTYDGKNYAIEMLVERNSYHEEELPSLVISVNPGSYTFAQEAEEVDITINAVHQHGKVVYDVEGNAVETVYNSDIDPNPATISSLKDNGWETILTIDYGGTASWNISAEVISNNTIRVKAPANNTGIKRSAILKGTLQESTRHEHNAEFAIQLHQRGTVGGIQFITQPGFGASDSLKNIWGDRKDPQPVHTAERTIYYTKGQQIELKLAESGFSGYMRWYDYETGGNPHYNDRHGSNYPSTDWHTQPRSANGSWFVNINTPQNSTTVSDEGYSWGLYALHKSAFNQTSLTQAQRTAMGAILDEEAKTNDRLTNPSPILYGWNYSYNADATTDEAKRLSGYHTMACDVSAYTDYEITTQEGNATRITHIKEPTLSYRQLFHLKPAEEIANKFAALADDKYLEEYSYMAPVGPDVYLATEFRHAAKQPETEKCYFYWKDGVKDGTLLRVDGVNQIARWYDESGRDITPGTYNAKDYLDVDAQTPGTKIYYLRVPNAFGGEDLRIAKFTVDFVHRNACGPSPALMSMEQIRAQYKVLEYIDFSFGAPAPGTTAESALSKPLPWTYATYGFVYPSDITGDGNVDYVRGDNQGEFPYFGEYRLVNTVNKNFGGDAGVSGENHGGAANGYAMYVDGTMEPGMVASISTKAVICSAQTMYCSMWLRNPSSTAHSGALPIFRCNIQGRKKTNQTDAHGDPIYTQWEDAGVFFVGSINKNSGWQQIVFPVNSANNYDETRVSLYNFATDNMANDFMIDDICLFVSQLPFAAYQGKMACRTTANSATHAVAVLRLDYSNIDKDNDGYMYYQILNETTGNAVNLSGEAAYYHEAHTGGEHTAETYYGSIEIPDQNYKPTTYYQSVTKFVDDLMASGQKNGKAYVRIVNDGVEKYLLYVGHIIENTPDIDKADLLLYSGHEYTLRMAHTPNELDKAECNMRTPLHATQATFFELEDSDGSSWSKIQSTSYNHCSNQLYFLTTKIENTLALNVGGSLETPQAPIQSDWLVIYDTWKNINVYAEAVPTDDDLLADYNARLAVADTIFKQKYTYTRGQIANAILHDMRRIPTADDPNPNYKARSFKELDPNYFQTHQNYQIIKHLCDNDWLEMHKTTTFFYLGAQDTARYLVYPIEGTAKAKLDGHNDSIVLKDCKEERYVAISSMAWDYHLNATPIPHAEKTNHERMQLPIVKVLLDNIHNVQLPITDLFSTDYEDIKIGEISYSKNATITINLTDLPYYMKYMNMTTGKVMETPLLEVGKEYTLRLQYSDKNKNYNKNADGKTLNGQCPIGYVFFRLLVMPNTMVWTPEGASFNGWGKNENWRGWVDTNGNSIIDEDELTEGFVPIRGSNVVIPNLGNSALYPYIVPEEGHNHYEMTVNFDAHHCKNIYFQAGAQINNQHFLHYEKAFVDMQVPAMNWHMMASPLEEVYSGDIFIPHTSYGMVQNPEPFEIAPWEGQRYSEAPYAFWQSHFNRTVTTHYSSGATTSALSSNTAEFAPTNSLDVLLEPGTGFQIKGLGPNNHTSDELIVRLPKNDNQYYYYSSRGEQTDRYATIPRTSNHGKLAYDNRNASGEKTITLRGEEASNYFVFGNPTMAYIDLVRFLETNTNIKAVYQMSSSTWLASTELSMYQTADRYLAPTRSVLVEVENSSTTLTLSLLPQHLTLSNVYPIAEDVEQVAPRQRVQSTNNDTHTMTIYAFNAKGTARGIIAYNDYANDGYLQGEDALFLSTGIETKADSYTPMSPINLYSLHNRVPMMVDMRENIDTIPLAMLVSPNHRTAQMQMAFYFSQEWNKTCYLYDAQTDTKTRIMDGLVLTLDMPFNHQARYYIVGPDRTANGENIETAIPSVQDQENKVWSYAQQGAMTVCSNDIIQAVTVYDVTGRLVAHETLDLLSNQVSLPLGQGVHIAEVTLRDNSKHYTRTIVK